MESKISQLQLMATNFPDLHIYGGVSFLDITISIGLKTAKEHIDFIKEETTNATKLDGNKLYNILSRMMLLTSLLRSTKLASHYFVPTEKSQMKEFRKIAPIFAAIEGNVEYNSNTHTCHYITHNRPIEITDDVIQSIIDEFKYNAFHLINSGMVEINLENKFTYIVLEENISRQTFFEDVKSKLNKCAVETCQEKGTKKCAICLARKYCSAKCQKHDWIIGGHKQTCHPQRKSVFIKGDEFRSFEEAKKHLMQF